MPSISTQVTSSSATVCGKIMRSKVAILASGTRCRNQYPHQQALDTSTPSGRAMFQMCGVFAEFERGMIRERVAAGLSRAKAQGKTLGRPKAGADTEARIRDLHDGGNGMGKLKIAKTLGIDVSVVQRVLAP